MLMQSGVRKATYEIEFCIQAPHRRRLASMWHLRSRENRRGGLKTFLVDRHDDLN